MSLRSNNGLLLSPPPPQPADENRINPSILLIIVIVSIIFFVSGLLHLLVRCLLRPTATAVRDPEDADVTLGATALQGQLQQLFHLHDAGVDQAFIDALPVFPYKAIVGKLNDPFDCAVCLCEFEPDHKMRLLPKCSHAFHTECIDTWLLAHSTCPLCRSALLPADFSPSRRPSPILLLLESASDGADAYDDGFGAESSAGAETEAAETKVVQVKLGKLRSVEGGSSSNDNGSSNLDQRRCFSMGTYEYVMNDSSLLQVAIKPSKKKPVGSRRYAVSECNCHSRREGFKGLIADNARISSGTRRESFSVSKIWLRSKNSKPSAAAAAASRRAFSFRMPALHCESKAKSAVSPRPVSEYGAGEWEKNGMDLDVEVGSCNNSVVSVGGSQIEGVPSFARRTLLWIVGRHNRVGSMS